MRVEPPLDPLERLDELLMPVGVVPEAPLLVADERRRDDGGRRARRSRRSTNITKTAMNRPPLVPGTTSPYPIVVTVVAAHHDRVAEAVEAVRAEDRTAAVPAAPTMNITRDEVGDDPAGDDGAVDPREIPVAQEPNGHRV